MTTPEQLAAATASRPDSIGDAARRWWTGVKAGDLGNLPIVVGLLAITIIFTSLNSAFLSPVNFVNLIVQVSPLAVIAMGVTFVLIIAEVDLSVGYLSGVAMVVLGRLLGEQGWPAWAAIIAVLLIGAFAGLVQGYLVAKVGLPSLIVTLAGLVGFNGLVLILIGNRGTVVIQDDLIIDITNSYLPPVVGYVLVLVATLGWGAVMMQRRRRRLAADLDADPINLVAFRVIGVTVLGAAAVYFASRSRGMPFVAVLLVVLMAGLTVLLFRTRIGRHLFAVGGNPEAARRAGINLVWTRVTAFMISGSMAALGGIVFASRLRSVDTGAGGGQIELNAIAAAVIGGTSLFGGRGTVSAALLGSFVIMGVDNGMGLLGLSSGFKFVVTAIVLLAAVLVDSVARRGQQRSGLA
ncbi:sugar ABC transporter permease [Salsipaludibacter albus]|uniref:sugar ABC transporter permease n=1 Tax=Salsipaludibacter albus TaxID=2849650 RepID=UPI001EE4E031|nr:ABC transporter permease [Salsipaludibacter albus]MBY5164152.1 ABC transporter permease [Salsipaludibacter albus]